MSVSKIVVLGTGGTIAGRAASARDNLAYASAEVGVADLLQHLQAPAGMQLLAEQVAQIDSKDMDFAVWRTLAQRCQHWLAQEDVAGVVVTHGTDTLEETAWFLQQVLAPAKPVVLTGARRPATSAAADGPQNLADALCVAAQPGARGVVVVFAGAVHGPHDVTKVHPYRTDAFSSGDAGALALVEEGQVRQLRAWPAGHRVRDAELLPLAPAWPRVEIVASHAAADGRLVEALAAQGVDGIVVACTGNGTVHHRLEAALQQVQRQGVAVRRATRCAQGVLLPHGEPALPIAAHAAPAKARVSLLLELMR